MIKTSTEDEHRWDRIEYVPNIPTGWRKSDYYGFIDQYGKAQYKLPSGETWGLTSGWLRGDAK